MQCTIQDLLLGPFYDQQLLSKISHPLFLCVKKKMQMQNNSKRFLLTKQTQVNFNRWLVIVCRTDKDKI